MGRRSRSRLKYATLRAERELRASFDHLVGAGEERGRNGEAERFGGLQVEDELKFRRLLDGQVVRRCPLQNSINIPSRPPVFLAQVRAVRGKPARSREFAKS